MSNVLRKTLPPSADVAPVDGPELTLASLFGSRFPSAALVASTGQQLSQFRSVAGRGGRRDGAPDAGVVWQISVAAGAVSLGTRDWGARERREAGATVQVSDGDYFDENEPVLPRVVFEQLVRPQPDLEDPAHWDEVERVCDVLEAVVPEHVDDESSARRITGWSAKSRVRMMLRLGQLDYAPLFADGHTPALQTLTLSDKWQVVAPTGAAFKRLMHVLQKRYQRAYGHRQVGVWKLEFQARGAPHLHVHCAPPRDAPDGWHPPACRRSARVCGHTYEQWLAFTWVDVCDHPDPDERARQLAVHLHPKTVDREEGLRSRDPKRLSVYFAKHGSFSAKEYQHDVPVEWQDGCGRFWGYWGLKPVVAVKELRPAVAIAAGRTLRRWSQSSDQFSWRTVWRQKVDRSTGEIRVHPEGHEKAGQPWLVKRRVKVPVKRMRSGRGFVLVNDGPALVQQLVRHLETVEVSSVPVQPLRPVWWGRAGLVLLPSEDSVKPGVKRG